MREQDRASTSRSMDRPGGLCARFAAVINKAHIENHPAADIARLLFADDQVLVKAATGPATTTGAVWAAELVGPLVQDVADNLLPESVLVQLRRASGLEY